MARPITREQMKADGATDAIEALDRLTAGLDEAKLLGYLALVQPWEGQIGGRHVVSHALDSRATAMAGVNPRLLAQRASTLMRALNALGKDVSKYFRTPAGIAFCYEAGIPVMARAFKSNPATDAAKHLGLLCLVGKHAEEFNSQRRPNLNRQVARLCRWVMEATGDWHDLEVARLLAYVRPGEYGNWDSEDLRQWRKKHRVTRRPAK